jgi:hypothetical protein
MLFELRRIGFAVHGAEFHLCTVCIHSEGDVSQLSDGLIGIRDRGPW